MHRTAHWLKAILINKEFLEFLLVRVKINLKEKILSLTKLALMAQTVKNLPAMQETRVQSLGWEDPLEKGMASYSSILAWRIPWTEEPVRLQSVGLQRVRHD